MARRVLCAWDSYQGYCSWLVDSVLVVLFVCLSRAADLVQFSAAVAVARAMVVSSVLSPA